MIDYDTILHGRGRHTIGGAPDGMDGQVLAALAAAAHAAGRSVLHVSRDDARMDRVADLLRFFDPDLTVAEFPAWDCLPYDRVSPNGEIVSRRTATLSVLANVADGRRPDVVLTTVNAALQRLPPRDFFAGEVLALEVGDGVGPDKLLSFLRDHGYGRVSTVREPGEFAVRGGIVDLYPPGEADPLRLDFFGDTLEAIRVFDPVSQRSGDTHERLALRPVAEMLLDAAAIERFRSEFRSMFGRGAERDPLYEAVSAGRSHGGIEHWLPLFHDRLETLFDYLDGAVVALDHQTDEAVTARLDSIAEYYAARLEFASAESNAGVPPYRPIPPDRLYLDDDNWNKARSSASEVVFSPFRSPDESIRTFDAGGRGGETFSAARTGGDQNLFEAVRERIHDLLGRGVRPVICAFSPGSRERLRHILAEHGMAAVVDADNWGDLQDLPAGAIGLALLPLERGFANTDTAFIAEPDILGDRFMRPVRRRRRGDAFLTELSSLNDGDFVVHVDHGIGQYAGLETLTVGGAPHDCLSLRYDGGDRLYLPVENMDMLTRYGSEDSGAQLDRLGGVAWQARKARVRERVNAMADKLIAVAAERALHAGETMRPPEGMYDEFAARFPYSETDDQQNAIDDVFGDMGSGKPMDRLVCGDVGFGKTEVALRSAFVAVMNGSQVAVVAPTTLLARQHYQTFRDRFAGLPVRLAQLSRLVGAKEARSIKDEVARGEVDILIGTHAILSKSVTFQSLGLLVVDEEQHFGVAQKERLKQLRADVHVLTLTATPIPRTLQLALAGVREMSLIATPPVDRLAVRTFVLPYDPVVIREAIMREVYRGGQIYYVCPRIEDLGPMAERLSKLVPDVKVATAHGRLAAQELESIMAAFYEHKIDLLLSTNIVESGLDIPTVNTIIIHRADRFGLAQLYQLRGRVGRSKVRAYAYLTLPTDRLLPATAQKRLEVMQTLDTLGAGFTLASHDLDIRGAGNLLGEEQSGHIREVGIELYQHMLEEAVTAARKHQRGEAREAAEDWVPQITVGTPVLIPEDYVADLPVRLSLYRRASRLTDGEEIERFAAELVDRFGPLPEAVDNLLEIVAIKALCRRAGVAKVDAGPKGATLGFRDDSFANPEGLIRFITAQVGTVKLRPDHTLVYRRQWGDPKSRIGGIKRLIGDLAALAEEPPRAASG